MATAPLGRDSKGRGRAGEWKFCGGDEGEEARDHPLGHVFVGFPLAGRKANTAIDTVLGRI